MAKPNLKNISLPSEIKQWGNSLGLRIPKEIRNGLDLSDGSRILISLNRKDKKIIIENMRQNKDIHALAKDINLSNLTKKISKKNKPKKTEIFSNTTGKEIW